MRAPRVRKSKQLRFKSFEDHVGRAIMLTNENIVQLQDNTLDVMAAYAKGLGVKTKRIDEIKWSISHENARERDEEFFTETPRSTHNENV